MTSTRIMARQEPQNFVTRHETDLIVTVRVTECDIDLGGEMTIAGELVDVLDGLLGGGLETGRRGGPSNAHQQR
jgi:hypothetical protein